ncbi:uncharacterized protein LOC108682346 [Hyalella azteca]|uniref:Uncharacterized protein LOC108682346 n=1 Tax=Hyalella azteca TaxID=294128 RepID=A0A979FPH4_HYAAZ|nr:uncharacterized protein LOC108682346 [Hyalella azteca]
MKHSAVCVLLTLALTCTGTKSVDDHANDEWTVRVRKTAKISTHPALLVRHGARSSFEQIYSPQASRTETNYVPRDKNIKQSLETGNFSYKFHVIESNFEPVKTRVVSTTNTPKFTRNFNNINIKTKGIDPSNENTGILKKLETHGSRAFSYTKAKLRGDSKPSAGNPPHRTVKINGSVGTPDISGSRSQWKKQNKGKHGGDHWVEYDFDQGTSTTTVHPSLPENPEGLKNPTLLVGLWIEEPKERESKAHFGGENNSLVHAQIDTTAKLPCVIFNRDDHETISWIRSRDHHLITVGRQTYSSDNRFSVNFNRHLSQWTLYVRYVQPRDAGEYICQLSTDPPMVHLVRLSVTAQASSVIAGGRERYVHEGSSVRLECVLQNHTQPPDYVFWYHNGTMINYDLNRKVSVEATTDGSVLTLLSVGRTDSGNYTCSPANAQFASITLHIILGDTLAAMKVSGASELASYKSAIFVLLSVYSTLRPLL